jgi:hypothetical protein
MVFISNYRGYCRGHIGLACPSEIAWQFTNNTSPYTPMCNPGCQNPFQCWVDKPGTAPILQKEERFLAPLRWWAIKVVSPRTQERDKQDHKYADTKQILMPNHLSPSFTVIPMERSQYLSSLPGTSHPARASGSHCASRPNPRSAAAYHPGSKLGIPLVPKRRR